MNWPEYAMLLAESASKKSKDPWMKVGACLLRHDNTPVLGFNGFPSKVKEDWSDREKRRLYVVHAEQNALRYIKPEECYLAATTLLPCNDCLKALRSYGIRKVFYRDVYKRDASSLEVAEDLDMELIKLE